jgi:small subunit ribosomal protein S7
MRGKQATKRKIKPDEIYGSITVAKLINRVMQDGKKSIARTIVYKALDTLGKESKMEPVKALEQVYENIRPRVEVRSKRVGGANYQVPTPVREDRQLAIANRWIVAAAQESRGNVTFAESLAKQLVAAFNKEGVAVKKREEMHKMAEANRAFAQFA